MSIYNKQPYSNDGDDIPMAKQIAKLRDYGSNNLDKPSLLKQNGGHTLTNPSTNATSYKPRNVYNNQPSTNYRTNNPRSIIKRQSKYSSGDKQLYANNQIENTNNLNTSSSNQKRYQSHSVDAKNKNVNMNSYNANNNYNNNHKGDSETNFGEDSLDKEIHNNVNTSKIRLNRTNSVTNSYEQGKDIQNGLVQNYNEKAQENDYDNYNDRQIYYGNNSKFYRTRAVNRYESQPKDNWSYAQSPQKIPSREERRSIYHPDLTNHLRPSSRHESKPSDHIDKYFKDSYVNITDHEQLYELKNPSLIKETRPKSISRYDHTPVDEVPYPYNKDQKMVQQNQLNNERLPNFRNQYRPRSRHESVPVDHQVIDYDGDTKNPSRRELSHSKQPNFKNDKYVHKGRFDNTPLDDTPYSTVDRKSTNKSDWMQPKFKKYKPTGRFESVPQDTMPSLSIEKFKMPNKHDLTHEKNPDHPDHYRPQSRYKHKPMDFQEPYEIYDDQLKYPKRSDLHKDKNKEHPDVIFRRTSRFESRPRDNEEILTTYKGSNIKKNIFENRSQNVKTKKLDDSLVMGDNIYDQKESNRRQMLRQSKNNSSNNHKQKGNIENNTQNQDYNEKQETHYNTTEKQPTKLFDSLDEKNQNTYNSPCNNINGKIKFNEINQIFTSKVEAQSNNGQYIEDTAAGKFHRSAPKDRYYKDDVSSQYTSSKPIGYISDDKSSKNHIYDVYEG